MYPYWYHAYPRSNDILEKAHFLFAKKGHRKINISKFRQDRKYLACVQRKFSYRERKSVI